MTLRRPRRGRPRGLRPVRPRRRHRGDPRPVPAGRGPGRDPADAPARRLALIADEKTEDGSPLRRRDRADLLRVQPLHLPAGGDDRAPDRRDRHGHPRPTRCALRDGGRLQRLRALDEPRSTCSASTSSPAERPGRPLGREAPASRPVRLGRADAEDGVEGEAVEVPRRRPGARRAVRRGEGVAFTCTGQPPSRKCAASTWRVGASVTCTASPSKTRSSPVTWQASVQAGFAARLRPLRVPGPIAIRSRRRARSRRPRPRAGGHPGATSPGRSYGALPPAIRSRGRLQGKTSCP